MVQKHGIVGRTSSAMESVQNLIGCMVHRMVQEVWIVFYKHGCCCNNLAKDVVVLRSNSCKEAWVCVCSKWRLYVIALSQGSIPGL
jgi:hypothetical protein